MKDKELQVRQNTLKCTLVGVGLKMGKVAVQVGLFVPNWNTYVPQSFPHSM